MEPTAKQGSGASGGGGVGNGTSPTLSTPATSGIQPGMSHHPPYVPHHPAYAHSPQRVLQIPPSSRSDRGTPDPHPAPLLSSPQNLSNKLHPGTLPPVSDPPNAHPRPGPNGVLSPIPTPSTTIAPPGPGVGGEDVINRLDAGEGMFFPGRVAIKTLDGGEVDFDTQRLAEEKEKGKGGKAEEEKKAAEEKEAQGGENMVTTPPSVTATARIIKKLGHALYPEGVTGPEPELNVDSKGRFRYDREFLLQFMAVCTKKPDALLDIVGINPQTRGDHSSYRTSSAAMPPPIPGQVPMSRFESDTSSGFTMGQFSSLGKATSERGLVISQSSMSTTVTGPGGPGSNRTRSKRTRSKRDGGRNESNKVHAVDVSDEQASRDQVTNLKLVAPLEVSVADGWSVAGGSTTRPPPKAGDLSNFGKINKFGPAAVGPSRVWAGKKGGEKSDSTLTGVKSNLNTLTMLAGGSTPRPPPKAGDLSNFGKINKSGPAVMGPSRVWAGKKGGAKHDSTLARVNQNSNMFTMLSRDAEAMPETSSRPSQLSRT